MMEWISVKDRLPSPGEQTLSFSDNRIFHCIFDQEPHFEDKMKFYDFKNYWEVKDVTHWMLLPNAPEE